MIDRERKEKRMINGGNRSQEKVVRMICQQTGLRLQYRIFIYAAWERMFYALQTSKCGSFYT